MVLSTSSHKPYQPPLGIPFNMQLNLLFGVATNQLISYELISNRRRGTGGKREPWERVPQRVRRFERSFASRTLLSVLFVCVLSVSTRALFICVNLEFERLEAQIFSINPRLQPIIFLSCFFNSSHYYFLLIFIERIYLANIFINSTISSQNGVSDEVNHCKMRKSI